MSSSIAAVEARLLDDPADADAWRLHASWLRAHGDPRAGLIDLAASDTPADRAALATALANGRASWTPDGVTAKACTWRHGFVVAAAIDVAGRADARGVIRMLADPRARLLGALRLNIGDQAPSRGLSLLSDADLGRLRSLQAPYHRRGDRIVAALVRQPALHLRVLDLRHSDLSDDGLIALAGCELRLRSLHLQRNRFTARGVAALVSSKICAQLEHLDLRHNAIGSDGAAAVARSPHLGGLAALHLYAGELDPAGVHALATSTTLPRDMVRLWRAQETR